MTYLYKLQISSFAIVFGDVLLNYNNGYLVHVFYCNSLGESSERDIFFIHTANRKNIFKKQIVSKKKKKKKKTTTTTVSPHTTDIG